MTPILRLALFLGIPQLLIFFIAWYYYFTHPTFKCPCIKFYHGFPLAKSSALLINFNLFLLLLFSSKFYRRYLYIPIKPKTIHLVVVLFLVFWSLFHSICHYTNISRITTNFTLAAFGTSVGLTGHTLLLLLILLWVTTKLIRTHEVFVFSHLVLSIVFISIASIHGTFCFIKYTNTECPKASTWLWILPPLAILVVENIVKYTKLVNVHSARLIEDSIIELQLPINSFHTGRLVWLCCPQISPFQWHPFTVTEYRKDTLSCSVHIKVRGDWTKQLAKKVESKIPLQMFVQGPFKSVPHNFTKSISSKPFILVSSGIGITTFVGPLQKLVEAGMCQQLHGHFVIVCQHFGEISWALNLISNKLFTNIHVHIFITQSSIDIHSSTNTLSNILLYHHRPDFHTLFTLIFTKELSQKTNVYFSGSDSIYKSLCLASQNFNVYKAINT